MKAFISEGGWCGKKWKLTFFFSDFLTSGYELLQGLCHDPLFAFTITIEDLVGFTIVHFQDCDQVVGITRLDGFRPRQTGTKIGTERRERDTHAKFPRLKTGVLPFATRTRHSVSRGYFLTIMFSLFLWEENTGTVLLNFPWDPRKLSRRTGELREEARHFSHSRTQCRLLLKKMLNGQPS